MLSNNAAFKLIIDLKKIDNTIMHEMKHGFCWNMPAHF